MLTNQQIQILNLGIDIDDITAMFVNAALEYVEENTNIDVSDVDKIPAKVKIFILKYLEITQMRVGVSSESIDGLSLSYSDGNQLSALWDIANELFGNDMKSRLKFVAAENPWK